MKSVKKPLAIGLIGPLPPPSGGMANQTRQLARLLSEFGVAVKVVQVNSPYAPAWVARLRGLRAFFRLVPYLKSLWQCAGTVDLMHVMANSGWAWHLCAAPAVWIAQWRGVPVIVNYRGGEAEVFLNRQSAWVTPTLRRARSVIVPSGFLEAVFRRFGIATTIVPNIIDLDRFHPAPLLPVEHHLVVARNLEDIYDIPTALRAFARVLAVHPVASMTVAGSGPRLIELQELARELGVANQVRFSGRLENDHMAELYRNASLMLNPSTADNMPISLLEAMASGVPVVSTDVGGIPYLVEDGKSALLVPPRDPSALAAAALRVLAEPALAQSLRQAGIATASQFTWKLVRPRLFDVYAEVLGVTSLSHCTS